MSSILPPLPVLSAIDTKELDKIYGPPPDMSNWPANPSDIPTPIVPVRPSQQTGQGSTPQSSIVPDILKKAWNWLAQPTQPGTVLGWDVARVIILILGLLLITAGLFSFKQTQVVIDKARKGAELLSA